MTPDFDIVAKNNPVTELLKKSLILLRVTDGWLCCIATYERLTIARIISNLLKILFFCNQSDQI
ncbi:hypothetical protein [Wolbachia endosymbiont (group A) of Rhinocyllus conicus]|uniref:hypothetical protein n=1 Tax=Wolbachia endosymbiont (group A) of Rhinocyllus conicus TaxID=2954053 RepID=UPI002226733E|nr:hypothetical protein [Wolbachia endosymbiont (group A) of Rhinocyllus conicus]